MKIIDVAVKGVIKAFIYFAFSISLKVDEMPIVMTSLLALALIAIAYTTVKAIQKAVTL
jgi:hypothetical protein